MLGEESSKIFTHDGRSASVLLAMSKAIMQEKNADELQRFNSHFGSLK